MSPSPAAVPSNKSLDDYFEDKPDSLEIFDSVAETINSFGTSDLSVKSQISWGRARKFAWFWLYNVTKKNPDGVPHLMLALDRKVDSDHIRNVEQTGKQRWNHQIVLRTLDDARSEWLADLLEEAYL